MARAVVVGKVSAKAVSVMPRLDNVAEGLMAAGSLGAGSWSGPSTPFLGGAEAESGRPVVIKGMKVVDTGVWGSKSVDVQ